MVLQIRVPLTPDSLEQWIIRHESDQTKGRTLCGKLRGGKMQIAAQSRYEKKSLQKDVA
jgi:hypothetical protein